MALRLLLQRQDVKTHASVLPAGGHLNPAVTLGFLIAKKISLQRAFCYWIAQVHRYCTSVSMLSSVSLLRLAC